jgi:hypothetical protein
MAKFKVIQLNFFYDTNNDGIVIVLKYHLCMFGSFKVSSLMEMRLDDSARYHFYKPCHPQDGLEWKGTYQVWEKGISIVL